MTTLKEERRNLMQTSRGKIEYKKVDLPDYDYVPRWLLLTGEIDLRYFILEQMFKDWDRQSGLTKMIDQATGYEEQLQADAKELVAEINWLRREYDKEVAPPKQEVDKRGKDNE